MPPNTPGESSKEKGLGACLRRRGLSLAFLLLFLGAMFGQTAAGMAAYNEELEDHGKAPLGLGAYLLSGHFLEATFENWESEFLQMGLFVLLTVKLYQKGSSESKTPGEPHESEEDPRKHASDPDAPAPVRAGGWRLKLYEHSLSLALMGLFLAAFVSHGIAGHKKANEEAALLGEPQETLLEFIGSAEFWFESMQNWQSEFLAVFAIVVLSVYLRERGSPQSKPVATPHAETGG